MALELKHEQHQKTAAHIMAWLFGVSNFLTSDWLADCLTCLS